MDGHTDSRRKASLLDLLCVREGDVWRVYVRPSCWLPPDLRRSFDHHEAYPVLLDLDDLDRHMGKRGLVLMKHVSTDGDVQLVARGDAADALMDWLRTMFSSGMRLPPSADKQAGRH